jgi:hypothetical protein
MAYLPVPGADFCQMMNLPADMADNPLWALHSGLVMGLMARYAIDEAMDDASTYTPEEPEEGEAQEIESDYYYALRLAYSYFLLAHTAHLLNLKTLGQGIVKSIGLDSTTTSLLTGNEMDMLADTLEMKGLKALGNYISVEGLSRERELTPAPKRFRIGVI